MRSDSPLVPDTIRERVVASLLRAALRAAVVPVLSPRVPLGWQRRWLTFLSYFTAAARGVDIVVGSAGGVPGQWLRPGGTANATILYFHGGAYCTGAAATHRAFSSRLARAAWMPVFAADYRLAPEHPFPAAVEDAVTAYSALAETGPVVLAGDSAGGGLALTVACAARDQKLRAPLALVLLSPWIDLKNVPEGAQREVMTRADWLRARARDYLVGKDAPRLNDLTGLPPILIQAGAEELLLRDATQLHDALDRAGVAVTCEIVPGRWHALQLYAGMLPSADAAIVRAAEFIATHSAHARESRHPELGQRTGSPL